MTGFLFVEKIVELIPGKKISGIKRVSESDAYCYRNKKGDVVFWPSLIGETIGQLCAWNVMQTLDFQSRPVAGISQSVSVLGEAKRGDLLALHAEILELDSERVLYQGTASINDVVIFKLENTLGPLLPMSDFIDENTVRSQFQSLIEPHTRERHPVKHFISEAFDECIFHEGRFTAYKKIQIDAPYFLDHFPRKPVLPLTVLLHCKAEAAHQFLEKSLGLDPERLQLSRFFKIKMSRFVEPGQFIQTTISAKSVTSQAVHLAFLTTVDNDRVCIAEAEFKIIP